MGRRLLSWSKELEDKEQKVKELHIKVKVRKPA
jgi:hypothetical protein